MENPVKPTLGRKSLPAPLHPSEPARNHQEERIRYWDAFATKSRKEGLRRYYRSRLMEIFRFVVAPGAHVLELGCGKGDLLAALDPARGLGVDFSGEMIRQARALLHIVEVAVPCPDMPFLVGRRPEIEHKEHAYGRRQGRTRPLSHPDECAQLVDRAFLTP